MADKKITALTELTATGKNSAADLLHIIDYSASPVNKKISVANLFSNVNSDTHIYGVSKTFEVGSTSTTGSALKVLNGSALSSGNESSVTINDDMNEFVDFIVKSNNSASAIHVDSSDVSSSGNSNIVFINGDAGNVDFCVKGDNFSSTNPVIFSDGSYDALGIGTNVLDGNYTVQVAADPTTGGSIQSQGFIAFSGSDSVNSETASQTASADTPVTLISLSGSTTSNTLELPTTDVYQGQIKHIVCNAEASTGTLLLSQTNRIPTKAVDFQDLGDAWTGMWDTTASKWISLSDSDTF